MAKTDNADNADNVPAVFDVDGQYPIMVELKRLLWGKQSFDLNTFLLDGDGLTFDFPNTQGHMVRVWVPRDEIGIITQRHDDPVEEDEEDENDNPLEAENADDELK